MTRTIFTGGRVFDGTGAALADADVVVEDAGIVDVGPGLDGDEAVDCHGKAVLPGLFDTHVHLAMRYEDFDETAAHRNDIGNDNRTKGLLIPNGVVSFGVDEKGILHVANPGKHRVERYTPQGELLGHFGRFDGHDPEGFTGCCNPTNVAVSGSRIFVTEKAGPRAKVYDFAGKLVAVIAADVFDSNCKNMSIAAGPRGRVYVADTVKLQIFAFEPGAA